MAPCRHRRHHPWIERRGGYNVDPGDPVFVPDQLWGNYNMILPCAGGVGPLPVVRQQRGFRHRGFAKAPERRRAKSRGRPQFSNNPTVKHLDGTEADAIARAPVDLASRGVALVVCDDAYFGLPTKPTCTRSPFSRNWLVAT